MSCDKLKQAEELLHVFGEAKYREGKLWRGWGWISASRARNKEKQLLSLISQLVEENEKLKQRVIDLQGHSNIGAVLTNSTITGDG